MSDSDNNDILGQLKKDNVFDSIEYKALLEQLNTVSDQLTTVEAENLANASALSKARNDTDASSRLISDLEGSVNEFRGTTQLRQTPMSYSKLDTRPHWNVWKNKILVYGANDFGSSFAERTAHIGPFMANMRKRVNNLLKYYHSVGLATCQYPLCRSVLLTDPLVNTLSAIVCPRCCSILYCSLHCMTHHSRIHGLLCAPSIAWAPEVPKNAKRKQAPTV
jgi:hypothetical protein